MRAHRKAAVDTIDTADQPAPVRRDPPPLAAKPFAEARGLAHQWLGVAAGRICEVCMRTEATGEFTDAPDCEGAMRRSSSAVRGD